jgi:hypothetical protein
MWHSLSGASLPAVVIEISEGVRALASVQTIDPPMPLNCGVRLTGDEAFG